MIFIANFFQMVLSILFFIFKLFNDADADGDGDLSWPELYSFDIKNYMLQTLAGISTNELPGCKHTPDDSEDMKIRKYPQQARDEL